MMFLLPTMRPVQVHKNKNVHRKNTRMTTTRSRLNPELHSVVCMMLRLAISIQYPLVADGQTYMVLRNHDLDEGPDPPWEGVILGERGARCKV